MPFEFTATEIPAVQVITASDFHDSRGYFLETFRGGQFAAHGIDLQIAQVNESVSRRATLRGMHYQLAPHAHGKLVRVLRGAVLDVAVDLRRDGGSFGQFVARELSADRREMMWIPPGFAHGFCALEEDTHFLYLQSGEYLPAAERGFHPLDPDVGIEWPFRDEELILSDKDRALPTMAQAESNFDA